MAATTYVAPASVLRLAPLSGAMTEQLLIVVLTLGVFVALLVVGWWRGPR